jgi:hypothetical protein
MRTNLGSRWSFTVIVFASLLFLASLPATGTQVTLPVTTSSSTMTVTLCADPGIGQQCDTDSSPISGSVVISLDDNTTPGAISIRNYDMYANNNMSLSLVWRIIFEVARVDATATGLGLSHPTPGPHNPFYPVSGTSFTATDVPYQTRGSANYSGGGLTCNFLNPCSGAFDLSTNGPSTIASVPGTITVNNGVATVHLDLTVAQYLDDANPSLGTLTVHAVVDASGPVPSGLVPFGSDWRYLDNGSDQGTAWQAPGFDDSAWLLGPAELGYGDGGEATLNGFGPDPNNKYITTYYRHAFNVANPAAYTNLIMRLLRDDGAVVYLNGQEVFRSNMPTGQVNYLTPALYSAGGLEETIYFAKALSPASLQSGRNVLAVELHQNNGTSSDISFDLELQGNFSFSNLPPIVAITSPADGAVVTGGGFTVQATASDPDGVVTLVEFFQDGVKIGEVAGLPPYTSGTASVAVSGLCPGAYTYVARAWDNSGGSSNSAPVTVNVIRPSVVLVAQGSDWKYFDKGTDQGTAWRNNSFDDTSWASGPAPLGYGEMNVGQWPRTTNSFGPDPNNKYVTTWYRHKFVVNNAGSVLGMVLHLLRDDGAVVYINSNEVFRSNMPTGAITSTTLTTNTVSGTDETNFVSTVLSANTLVSGTNLIAVEIHQSAVNSSDIAFDLQLEAGYANQAPLVLITNPLNGAEIPAGGSVLLQASAVDVDGAVARLEFYAGTNKLGQVLAPPYQLLWNSPASGQYTLTAVAYDDCGLVGVSPSVQVSIGSFSMVRTGAVWKYLDTGVYPGASWTTVGFNDAAWRSGPAHLGYGDGDEATTVGYGSDPNNKYITTWFRRSWQVPDKSVITGLMIRLLRDDGAVIYLNGTEVFRSNMPDGTITPTTLATNAVAGAEETAWFTTQLSPAQVALLRNGLNTLAVEIHQSSTNSSDISFDLELVATTHPASSYLLVSGGSGGATVTWPSWAIGYRLYQTHDLRPQVRWELAPAAVQDNGTWRSVTLPPPSTNTYYQLGW